MVVTGFEPVYDPYKGTALNQIRRNNPIKKYALCENRTRDTNLEGWYNTILRTTHSIINNIFVYCLFLILYTYVLFKITLSATPLLTRRPKYSSLKRLLRP